MSVNKDKIKDLKLIEIEARKEGKSFTTDSLSAEEMMAFLEEKSFSWLWGVAAAITGLISGVLLFWGFMVFIKP